MSISLDTRPQSRPLRRRRLPQPRRHQPVVSTTMRSRRVIARRSSGDRARRLIMTPLGAVSRGLVAGAVGTLAMDAWEFSSGLDSWDQAPAPAQVGKRLAEGLFEREIPPRRAALVNNVTHWGYGMLGGAQYGIVAGSLRTPRVRYGLPFGVSVWAASYAVLPAAKLYKPIWDYDRTTLLKDLSAHLVYGLGTATALKLMPA
jgi:hypothetical protein